MIIYLFFPYVHVWGFVFGVYAGKDFFAKWYIAYKMLGTPGLADEFETSINF